MNKRPAGLDEYLSSVHEAARSVLKAESAASVKRGLDSLHCLASTSCLKGFDQSWDEAGGVSFELIRCALPPRLLQAFKARLHGTPHWERFARDSYHLLFHAVFRDILPESPLVHDHAQERAATCSRVKPDRALESLADAADKMRREDLQKARRETGKLLKRLGLEK